MYWILFLVNLYQKNVKIIRILIFVEN